MLYVLACGFYLVPSFTFIGIKCACIAHRPEKSFYTRTIMYKSCADCKTDIKSIVFLSFFFKLPCVKHFKNKA